MKYYQIKYDQIFDEQTLYLFKHDNCLLKGIKDLDLSKHSAIIVGDFDYTEQLLINDYGRVYTEVTETIKDYLLNCKEIDALRCTLYVNYQLTEDDINAEHDYSLQADYEYLMHITEDQWIEASNAFVKEELSEEEAERLDQVLDQIDAWMAKGRNSLRAEQRGDEYCGNKN